MHSTVKRPRRTQSRRTARRADERRITDTRRTTAAKITAGQQQHWNRPTTLTGSLGAVAGDARWSA